MYWKTTARSIHASRLRGMKMKPNSGTKAIKPNAVVARTDAPVAKITSTSTMRKTPPTVRR